MKKRLIYAGLLLLSAALAYGLFSVLGNGKSVRTIGFISLTAVDQKTFGGFKEGMARLGYIENRDIVYLNDGPAGKIENLDAMVEAQLKKGVDLFFVSSTPGTLAVQHATINRNIPALFCPVNDPVASGIVASLEYPGGNLTGIRLPSEERRRFEWVIRLQPAVKTVLIPFTPGDKSSEFSRLEAYYSAQAHDIVIVEEAVRNESQLDELLARCPESIDAIFLPRDSKIESYIQAFVDYANEQAIPLAAPSLQQVESGALFAYGFIHRDMGRQAAAIADRILQGNSPASIPVETAKNHLILNLDTARKIGLTIPPAIREQAEYLIERTPNQ